MSTAGYPLPLPQEDAVTAPWWAATRDRRLVVQHCTSCGTSQHYPRPICTTCHGHDLGFAAATGRATVHSVTVVHRAPHPDLATPYVIALVDLQEGPRLLTRLVWANADPAAAWPAWPDPATLIDRPVDLDWWPLPDGRALPVFRPV